MIALELSVCQCVAPAAELVRPNERTMGQDRSVDLPPLPDTTILLVEVGSTAHGTGVPGGEDYDQLGVVV
jgi:hypothetical protein